MCLSLIIGVKKYPIYYPNLGSGGKNDLLEYVSCLFIHSYPRDSKKIFILNAHKIILLTTMVFYILWCQK